MYFFKESYKDIDDIISLYKHQMEFSSVMYELMWHAEYFSSDIGHLIRNNLYFGKIRVIENKDQYKDPFPYGFLFKSRWQELREYNEWQLKKISQIRTTNYDFLILKNVLIDRFRRHSRVQNTKSSCQPI